MLITILEILQFLINVYAFICFTGFCIYKVSDRIKTWEAGVYKIFSWIVEWLVQETTGQVPLDKIVDTSFILSDEEVVVLKNGFDKKPYNIPSIASTTPNKNGESWYDFTAIGLSREYVDMDSEERSRMCYQIIKNYFIETRKRKPDIYIFVASPVRLQFAIALSTEASKRLKEMQERFVREENLRSYAPVILEEEIDLWEDKKDSNDDSRL